MATEPLLNAFNECVDRLAAGESLDDCLRAYPALAEELRDLLTTVLMVRAAQPLASPAARARVWARVKYAAEQTRRHRAWHGGWLRLLAAAAAVVIVVGTVWLFNREPAPTRPGMVTVVPLATDTASPAPTATNTLAVPSATPSPGVTVSPSLTASPRPTTTPPPTATRRPSATPTPTLNPSATPSLSPTTRPTSTPVPPTCTPTRPAGWVDYTIQAGDTLAGIAVARGVPLDDLQHANCLPNPNLISAGQVIVVPALPVLPPSPGPVSPPPLDSSQDGPDDNSGSSGDGSDDEHHDDGSNGSDDHSESEDNSESGSD